MSRARNVTDADALNQTLVQHGCDVEGCTARAPYAHSRQGADAQALRAGWLLGQRVALCPKHRALALEVVGIRPLSKEPS